MYFSKLYLLCGIIYKYFHLLAYLYLHALLIHQNVGTIYR